MVIKWYFRILLTLYDVYNIDYRKAVIISIRERIYKLAARKTIYKMDKNENYANMFRVQAKQYKETISSDILDEFKEQFEGEGEFNE